MKTRCLALTALAAVIVLPAHAQTPTPFESQATGIATPCLQAESTPEAAPGAVTSCQKLAVDLAGLKTATPSLAGHDLNVYHVVMSMAQSRIASSYGRIDGVRSARVCQHTENAWSHVAKITPADSPSYAAMIGDLRSSSVGAIGKCRNEFGTPAGAAPLP